MNATPPAGWYPDPHGEAEMRYWDGATWTEHTSGEAGGAYAAGGPPAGGPGTAQAPRAPGGGPPVPLLVGLGAVVAIGVVVGVLFLTGVLGGDDEPAGNTDEDEITALIEETYENYDDPEVCDNWTDDYHETVEGGAQNCAPEVEANADEPDLEVNGVEVDEADATADIEADGESAEVELRKEDDEWLLDGELPGVCCTGEGAVVQEIRDVVEPWLSDISSGSEEEVCGPVTYDFMRDQGIRGQDEQLADRCRRRASSIVAALGIDPSAQVETVNITSPTGYQTATVTLSDGSELEVDGEPGDFWLINSVR